MGYKCEVLADSISFHGIRLTTICATFPRMILSEINTHRVFSRNSASSRAIPPERIIKNVMTDPFIPATFNHRVKGMGIGKPIEDQEEARALWLEARDHSVNAAKGLISLDVDKSRINRLLEPFMWHTAIISATEWENFLALRCPDQGGPDIDFPAQYEMQEIAVRIRDALRSSIPAHLSTSDWHLPFISEDEIKSMPIGKLKLVSARRCARVSFDKHMEAESYALSVRKALDLIRSGHLSPFEHVASPTLDTNWYGNFKGWVQMRKEFPYEWNYKEAIEAINRNAEEVEECLKMI